LPGDAGHGRLKVSMRAERSLSGVQEALAGLLTSSTLRESGAAGRR